MNKDEGYIFDFSLKLANKAQNHYRRRNITGIISVIDQLERLSAREDDVKKKLALDTTLANILTLAAEAHLDDLDFNSCFELCHCATTILSEAVELSRLDNVNRPHQGMSWCRLLYILADAKWKAPKVSYQDIVVPAAEMFSKLSTIVAEATEFLRNTSIEQEIREDIIHSLLWCGVMHMKLAMRFDRNRIQFVNNLMNALIPAIAHDPEWPYYWDIAIAEGVLLGFTSQQTIAHYYVKRRHCIAKRKTDRSLLAAYDKAAAKEMEYLLSCRSKRD